MDFSAPADRNKAPILDRLQRVFESARQVLEIGSGTGQHAVHFAVAMPWLEWTCSDLPERHETLRRRLGEANLPNLHGPLTLDVTAPWPRLGIDAAFAANVTHVMPWRAVEALFAGVAALLPATGRFVLYGPFHYGGAPVSPGNAEFDRELRNRGMSLGIRDAEAVQALAAHHGLRLLADTRMPANNRLFVWEKHVEQ